MFFTSDMHFGHFNMTCGPESKNLCNRPWETVDEMNEALIENWNATVGPTDIVWVLGDAVMGKIADTLPLISRLNGRKALVYGNHDRMFEPKKRTEWTQKYKEVGFLEICKEAYIHVPGQEQKVALSHFPYSGDSHDEDRFSEHRLTDNGMWLLHGHVHDAWRRNGRQINVGIDVWDYKPVHIDQIVELMES
jgi:calcineurin-like phosphoesterase family protein